MFSSRIIELRKEAKLTQPELGRIIGASRDDISNLERGFSYNPDYTLLLADFFNVSLDYLFGRTDNRKGIFVNSDEESATLEKFAI